MKPTSQKAVEYVRRARERFGRLTPFRLGIVVGEANDCLRVPYNGHQRRLYKQGVEFGQETRQRRAQRLSENADVGP